MGNVETMRVAYLSTDPSINLSKPGGPRAHILGTIQGMEKNGLDVERFFVGDVLSTKKESFADRGKHVSPPAKRSKLRLILSDMKRLVRCWSLSGTLESELDVYQPDVIYERSWLFSLGGMRYAKQHGIPIFFETPGCEAEITAKAYGLSSVKFANLVDSWKFRSAEAVVTQSVNSIESTIQKFNLNVPVIAKPIGFELNLETKVGGIQNYEEVMTFKKRFSSVVGFVGTFGVYQGPDFLMEVVRQMNEFSNDVGFLLIGGGGKQEECVEYAKKHHLENVFFTGMVKPDSIEAYLNECDLTFVPDCDRFMSPIKVLEYGAHGLPVIVPDYEAFDGLIVENKTGSRFEALNTDSAVDCIHQMVTKPEKIKEMSERIRNLIRNNFSLSHVLEPLVEAMRGATR